MLECLIKTFWVQTCQSSWLHTGVWFGSHAVLFTRPPKMADWMGQKASIAWLNQTECYTLQSGLTTLGEDCCCVREPVSRTPNKAA